MVFGDVSHSVLSLFTYLGPACHEVMCWSRRAIFLWVQAEIGRATAWWLVPQNFSFTNRLRSNKQFSSPNRKLVDQPAKFCRSWGNCWKLSCASLIVCFCTRYTTPASTSFGYTASLHNLVTLFAKLIARDVQTGNILLFEARA